MTGSALPRLPAYPDRPRLWRIARHAGLVVGIVACAPLAAQLAYVPSVSERKVAVIDTNRGEVVRTFALPGTLGSVAVGRRGEHIFVVSGENQRRNTILVVDTRGKILASLFVDGPPGLVVASRDRAWVFVVADKVVTVIDAVQGAIVRHGAVDIMPRSAAVSPDGKMLAVGDASGGEVAIVDTASLKVVARIAAAATPGGIAWSPTGAVLYIVDKDAGAVDVIDVGGRRITSRIAVGRGPGGLAVTGDGHTLYVTLSGADSTTATSPAAGGVAVVDISRARVTARPAVGGEPRSIAITPDGNYAYAVNTNGASVSVIATRQDRVIKTIKVGPNPVAGTDFISSVATP